jgi:hypothetical protein
MKLRHAIENVDRSPKNSEGADMETFGQALGIDGADYDSRFAERVVRHRLSRWQCTDSWVGTSVYDFDGVPVAVGHRPARKADEEIRFVSEEAGKAMREFILSLVLGEETEIDVIDPDEEIGEGYRVSYAGQIIDAHSISLDGRPVVIHDIKAIQTTRMSPVVKIDVRLKDGDAPEELSEAGKIVSDKSIDARSENGMTILSVPVDALVFAYKLRQDAT